MANETVIKSGMVYRIHQYCQECVQQRAISFQVASTCDEEDLDEMVDEVAETHLGCSCGAVGHFTDLFVYPLGRATHNGH